MNENEKENYLNMMKHFDTNQTGSLTDREMQQVLIQTQLDKNFCAKVWDLTNPSGEKSFSKVMFLVAMHLIYKKKMDPQVNLPDKIPIELYVSASEGDKQQELLASGINLNALDLNP